MTEKEEYTKLEDGVEFYLHNGKGEYWIPDDDLEVIENKLMWKQSTIPNNVWKIVYIEHHNTSKICINDLSWNFQYEYYIDTDTNQLCCKECTKDDEICHCFVDTCDDYSLNFKSLNNFNALEQHVKVCYEPVFVEFAAPFVLK